MKRVSKSFLDCSAQAIAVIDSWSKRSMPVAGSYA